VFHRLVMPDGFSANLDRFQGLNQIGDAGLRDQVNKRHRDYGRVELRRMARLVYS
jgi:type IV secretory pathway VirB10-like protein